jgi:hypothetical protein
VLQSVDGRAETHLVGVAGDNQRKVEYHRELCQTKGRTAERILDRRRWLEDVLDMYGLDGEVNVVGRDALAFAYTPKPVNPPGLYPVKLSAPGVDEVRDEE